MQVSADVHPLIDSHPPARIAFVTLLAIFALGEVLIRSRGHRGHDGAPERVSFVVIVLGIAAGIAGAFVLASAVTDAAIPDLRWVQFGVGLALIAAGIAVRLRAVAVLGRYFTVEVRVQADQPVVDRGPYRWVRHPAYSGLLLVCLGIGLSLTNWASLAVALVAPTAAIAVRVRVEERLLLRTIGEPYRQFCATRARLLPGIW